MSDAVIVAVIGFAGLSLAAWIPTRQIRKRVGSPNGHGSLIDMVTHLFRLHEETQTRVRALHEETRTQVENLSDVVQEHATEDREAFAKLGLQMGNLEHDEANRVVERREQAP